MKKLKLTVFLALLAYSSLPLAAQTEAAKLAASIVNDASMTADERRLVLNIGESVDRDAVLQNIRREIARQYGEQNDETVPLEEVIEASVLRNVLAFRYLESLFNDFGSEFKVFKDKGHDPISGMFRSYMGENWIVRKANHPDRPAIEFPESAVSIEQPI